MAAAPAAGRFVPTSHCPWPLLDLSQLAQSPSRKLGMSEAEERDKLTAVLALMREAGTQLALGKLAMSAAYLFAHRYFAAYSLQRSDRHALVGACLFLGNKVNGEYLKVGKLRDVARMMYKLRCGNEPAAMQRFREEPVFMVVCDSILHAERALLYATGFQLLLLHPAIIIADALRKLASEGSPESTRFWKQVEAKQNMCDHATAKLYERTRLCLRFDTRHLALGVIYTMLWPNRRKGQLPPPVDGKDWWAVALGPDVAVDVTKLEAIKDELVPALKNPPKAVPASPHPHSSPYSAATTAELSQGRASSEQRGAPRPGQGRPSSSSAGGSAGQGRTPSQTPPGYPQAAPGSRPVPRSAHEQGYREGAPRGAAGQTPTGVARRPAERSAAPGHSRGGPSGHVKQEPGAGGPGGHVKQEPGAWGPSGHVKQEPGAQGPSGHVKQEPGAHGPSGHVKQEPGARGPSGHVKQEPGAWGSSGHVKQEPEAYGSGGHVKQEPGARGPHSPSLSAGSMRSAGLAGLQAAAPEDKRRAGSGAARQGPGREGAAWRSPAPLQQQQQPGVPAADAPGSPTESVEEGELPG